MKKNASLLSWILIQLYVTFAILFYSKRSLQRIAYAGGNHPLYVFGVARWTRVWWLALLGIGFWFVWFGPWFNFILLGNSPKTWFGEVTSQYAFIFLGNHTITFAKYWLSGVFGGAALQILELWSFNKMEYFRSFLGLHITHYHEERISEKINEISV